eukprot:TRINITY_DN25659_c0_g1_i1.p1 TRINITY_DN25659_c0_g1~~TRINITY_DN25659_c0_g1_i1.p1  ORF type:complete len:1038 (+),score=175.95 TRINITY_DN25659_c0_g1_i1:70-3114(+)
MQSLRSSAKRNACLHFSKGVRQERHKRTRGHVVEIAQLDEVADRHYGRVEPRQGGRGHSTFGESRGADYTTPNGEHLESAHPPPRPGGPSPETLLAMRAVDAEHSMWDDAQSQQDDYRDSTASAMPPALGSGNTTALSHNADAGEAVPASRAVDAEVVERERLAKDVAVLCPFRIDTKAAGRMGPLSPELPLEAAELILRLRGGFFKLLPTGAPSGDTSIYPQGFEDWAVEAFCGTEPRVDETFAVLLDTFTLCDEEALLHRSKDVGIVQQFQHRDPSKRRYLAKEPRIRLLSSSSLPQLDGVDEIEAGRPPKAYKPEFYRVVMDVLVAVNRQFPDILEKPAHHLLARFTARHAPSTTVKTFMESDLCVSSNPFTWNCLLENIAVFAKDDPDRVPDVALVLDAMRARHIPIDTHALAAVLEMHLTSGVPKKGVGLAQVVLTEDRIAVQADTWGVIAELVSVTTSPANAQLMIMELRDRCIEEYGDTMCIRDCSQYAELTARSGTDRRRKQFPVFGRGVFLNGLLPTTFTVNLYMKLIHFTAVQGKTEEVLVLLKDYFERIGSLQMKEVAMTMKTDPAEVDYKPLTHNVAAISHIIESLSVSNPDECIRVLRKYIFERCVSLLPSVVARVASRLATFLKDDKMNQPVAERRASAAQLVRELTTYQVDACERQKLGGYSRLNLYARSVNEVGADLSLAVLKIAVFSKDPSLTLDSFNSYHDDCKSFAVPMSGNLVLKVLGILAARGWWRTCEAIVHTLYLPLGSLRGTSLYTSRLGEADPQSRRRILNQLLLAHCRDPPGSFEARSDRLVELALQTFVKGDVLEYRHLGTVLRVLADRASRDGDMLVPVQNAEPYIPLGIGPGTLRRLAIAQTATPVPPSGHLSRKEMGQLVDYTNTDWQNTVTHNLIGSGRIRKLLLSHVAQELIQYAVHNRKTITDEVVFEAVRVFLALGSADQITAVLVANIKRLLDHQARFASLVLECCENHGVPKAFDLLDTDADFKTNTETFNKFLHGDS